MKIVTRGSLVLLTIKDNSEVKTKAGLILKADTVHEAPTTGVVENFGPEVEGLKKGQEVLYRKYGGDEVTVDGKTYMLIPDSEILAIIKK